MIVRISGEAQYRVPDDQRDALNDLDNAAVLAVESADEDGFRRAFEEMLTLVRGGGSTLADEELTASDLILPPADISFAEAEAEFSGEGLIPE